MKVQKCVNSFIAGSAMMLSNAACSQSPPVVIPRTNVPLETLVFAPDQRIVQAVSTGTYDICRDDAMSPEFKVTSIHIWTGPIFRTAIKPSGNCPFAVYSKQRYKPQSGDIRTADCITRLRSTGERVTSIVVYVTEATKRHYFQCEYRLSMAFIGFQGALHMPENMLFAANDRPATTYGLPIERAFSRIMPAPFIRLQRACGSPISWFYKPTPGQTRAEVQANILNTPCKLR